ncbi:MAG: hypothetical protein A2Y94_00760 [Caldithrix sp. RBG_13_44_9]|nr:MAG: hypothetical protein A2Y94_00760 [Caldithrix sp. RBG_13_44_9]
MLKNYLDGEGESLIWLIHKIDRSQATVWSSFTTGFHKGIPCGKTHGKIDGLILLTILQTNITFVN